GRPCPVGVSDTNTRPAWAISASTHFSPMTTELAGTIPLCLCTRKPPAPSSCRRTSEMEPGSQLVVFDIVLFVGGRDPRRGRAASPEVLLALCLHDGFANVGLQVSARCLV